MQRPPRTCTSRAASAAHTSISSPPLRTRLKRSLSSSTDTVSLEAVLPLDTVSLEAVVPLDLLIPLDLLRGHRARTEVLEAEAADSQEQEVEEAEAFRHQEAQEVQETLDTAEGSVSAAEAAHHRHHPRQGDLVEQESLSCRAVVARVAWTRCWPS